MNIRKSVSSISKKRFSKRVALITAGVIVLAALFALGMVLQVRQERLDKAAADSAHAAQAAKDSAIRKQVEALTASNQALQADKAVLCTQIKTLSTAKATRSYAVVPLSAHCQ